MQRTDLLEKKYRQKLFREIGEYLASKRQNAGLKQSEVAKTSGYSVQFISNIECGAAFPPAKLLAKMIEAYGIGEKEFIETLAGIQMQYYREVYFDKGCSKKPSPRLKKA